ncbi:cytochrome P450 [Gordonia sp. TBRC 11910]|uniref:Cytochrome P450 n=1 Tax=Gordonia asplenii TaxID=2725283 RepID=A0A848KSJ1_9ACTN|nr:cytochrome P450 [Gordonia asplenii]
MRFDDAADAWIVGGYHSARSILRDAGWTSDPLASPTYRQAAAAVGLGELPLGRTMLLLDGPAHTRVRDSVRDVFTPSYIAQLRPAVEAIAADVIDGVATGPTFDFMTQVAQPFPIAVIAEWLGLDLPTATTLWREAPTLIRALDAAFDPASLPATASAFTALIAQFLPLAAQRRADPLDDLLSLLATDPALDLDEVVVNAILLAIAGHETTANLLGAAVIRLFDARQGRLIDDLDVDDPRLITELLRLDGPAQSILRVATEPHAIGGHVIASGEVVVVDVAAANRDPSVFDDPETFNPQRPASPPHLSFGFGVHRCIGAALAQLEVVVALDLLRRRGAQIAGPATARDSTRLRGLTSVPMIFTEGATP